MTNNDVLRRIRYTFDFDDARMIAIFALAEEKISRQQIGNWLKKDDHPDYQNCPDIRLASFLNGLIIERRGKKQGPLPIAEKKLSNNIVLRKLKIALDLRNEDVITMLTLAHMSLGKHELTAFLRRPGHKNYRECKDQVLRNFLKGMQIRYRPKKSVWGDKTKES